MKTPVLTFALALGILGAFFILRPSPPLLAQGSLTPPGAPAPVMKTLNQIEPRTPISALPFTISAPGSYYLTGNLTATTDGTAITVLADSVTIDLNGFTLAGGSVSQADRTGIYVLGALKGLCVRNGTVTGWTFHGISGDGMTGGLYENLRLTGNLGAQALRSGTGASVRACVVTGTANAGLGSLWIGSNSTISDCSVSSNIAGGISTEHNCNIVNCTVSSNGGTGIIGLNNCSVLNCTVSANASNGIIYVGSNCTVAHCTTCANSGNGIVVLNDSTVTDCTSSGNATGMVADTGCTISRCTFARNVSEGLRVTSRCHVTGCTIETNNPSNTAENPGLRINGGGNRIDSNHFANNGYAGLKAYAAGNLIIRNTFSGAQYIVAPFSNSVGPTVDMTAGGTISSASGTTGTNPWANIMF